MPSQTDLDQGGTFRQYTDVYMGPSIGWVTIPTSGSILRVTAGGTTAISPGSTLILVNVAALVTLTLPPAAGSAAGAGAVPGSYVLNQIMIVDQGGNAGTTAITINPAGSDTIDGLASISIASAFGALILTPDPVNGNWTISQ